MYPPLLLFHQVSYVWEQRYLTSTLDGLCHATLILQRCSGDAAREYLTLLVEELLEELRILVVDILDAALLETTILLFLCVH